MVEFTQYRVSSNCPVVEVYGRAYLVQGEYYCPVVEVYGRAYPVQGE